MTTTADTAATTQDFEQVDDRTPLPLRSDTILGVCEAIGQDFGVNPNWFRAGFAALLLWNVEIVIAAYLVLGLVVAATRWFFPAGRSAAVADEAPVAAETAAAAKADEREKELLAA